MNRGMGNGKKEESKERGNKQQGNLVPGPAVHHLPCACLPERLGAKPKEMTIMKRQKKKRKKKQRQRNSKQEQHVQEISKQSGEK